jgi:hypothetical protein
MNRTAIVSSIAVAALAGCAAPASSGRSTTTRTSKAAAAPAPRACPASGPSKLASPSWPAAKSKLVPAGASALRLCRYAGLNATPRLALLDQTLVQQHKHVARLVGELDALVPFPPGAFACPADDGSQILVLASYPAHHQLRVSVALTGCGTATNGSVISTTANAGNNPHGPKLLAQLKRLTGDTQPSS